MSRILTFAVIGLAGWSASTAGMAETTAPLVTEPPGKEAAGETMVIQLERAVHFSTADGSNVSIPSGFYRVEAVTEMTLRLVAETPRATREIPATSFTHEETLTAPLAFAVREQEQEDAVHLLLLLPGGQGLDAAGRTGEVQTRGGEFLLRSRSQYTGVVMLQSKEQMYQRQNEEMKKQREEAQRRFDVAMDRAVTEMVMGVASGVATTGTSMQLQRCDICKVLQKR